MVLFVNLMVALIVVTAVLAALGTGYVYAGRRVPPAVDWTAAVLGVTAVGMSMVNHFTAATRGDSLIASPFLLLGVLGIALIAVRRQRSVRSLPRRLSLWPTAMLFLALSLEVQGVAHREPPGPRALPGQAPISPAQDPARNGFLPGT